MAQERDEWSTLLVASGLVDGVTLSALGLEGLLTGLFVALRRLAEGCHGRLRRKEEHTKP